MRLVIKHEDTDETKVFDYESKERFRDDLFAALEEYLESVHDIEDRATNFFIGGIMFPVDFFLSYNALNNPEYNIPKIYTLKEWFAKDAVGTLPD